MNAIRNRIWWVDLYIRGSKPQPADEQLRNIALQYLNEINAISDAISEALALPASMLTEQQERKPPERIIDLNG